MNPQNNLLRFILDGQEKALDFATEGISPTTTVLNYLRSLPTHKGTKEGCAEGDCGACTVVVAEPDAEGRLVYKACDSCLMFLPMLHGKQLITVENLGRSDDLHPVQQAMVDCDGSQCGYCTPGFIMSMFALYKEGRGAEANAPDREDILDALTGNLCRCTGYRPIVEATAKACTHNGKDKFSAQEAAIAEQLNTINQETPALSVTHPSHYFRPSTLQEALALRAQHPDALLVCGATDVGLKVTKQKQHLPLLLDLGGVAELQAHSTTPTGLELGATLSLEAVKALCKAPFPALYDMLAVFGSRQIRHLGTLGGNLANASPIGDTPPVLMALDASVVVQSIHGPREMKVADFITGYRTTALFPNEIIAQVRIPYTPEGIVVKAYKVSKRKDLDISTVSGGFRLALDPDGHVTDIRLYYGGMAAMTKRAAQAEDFLRGKPWSRHSVEAAMDLVEAEFTPISDARSGKEGRRLMARNLLLKFWSDTQVQVPVGA